MGCCPHPLAPGPSPPPSSPETGIEATLTFARLGHASLHVAFTTLEAHCGLALLPPPSAPATAATVDCRFGLGLSSLLLKGLAAAEAPVTVGAGIVLPDEDADAGRSESGAATPTAAVMASLFAAPSSADEDSMSGETAGRRSSSESVAAAAQQLGGSGRDDQGGSLVGSGSGARSAGDEITGGGDEEMLVLPGEDGHDSTGGESAGEVTFLC